MVWKHLKDSGSFRELMEETEILDERHCSQDMADLCMTSENSDVTFVTDEGEKIPGHKVILASRYV